MRVVELYAENYKRVRAVHVVPEGDVVVLAGANAQGKTSVLDAIWAALAGAAAGKANPDPIRHGADGASVRLDLGELVVTRVWREGKASTLEVKNAEGHKLGSPQKILDTLLGKLSFDPLGFAGLDPKAQRAALLEVVELPFDLTELDAQIQQAFDARADANRELKQAQAIEHSLGNAFDDPDLPEQEVSATDLFNQLDVAQGYQQRAAGLRRAYAEAVDARCAAELELKSAYEAEQAAREAMERIPANLPDPAALRQRLQSIEETNRLVRERQAWTDAQHKVVLWGQIVESRSDTLEELRATRSIGLQDAEMPVPGLAVDGEQVTYQGVPLKQASGAEQLRVSVAMAMELNPKLRVLRITDGSLLDRASMAVVEQMAAEHDFQVWIERVDETGEVGIVIEDGQVKP